MNDQEEDYDDTYEVNINGTNNTDDTFAFDDGMFYYHNTAYDIDDGGASSISYNSTSLFWYFVFIGSQIFIVLLFSKCLLYNHTNRPNNIIQSYLSEPALILLIGMSMSFIVYNHTFDSVNNHQQQDDPYNGTTTNNNNASDNNNSNNHHSIYYNQNFDMMEQQFTFFKASIGTMIQSLRGWLQFSPNIVYTLLLPPVLFNNAYQLRSEIFYRHLQPIVWFACVGTLISTITTAVLLYIIMEYIVLDHDDIMMSQSNGGYDDMVNKNDDVMI